MGLCDTKSRIILVVELVLDNLSATPIRGESRMKQTIGSFDKGLITYPDCVVGSLLFLPFLV